MGHVWSTGKTKEAMPLLIRGIFFILALLFCAGKLHSLLCPRGKEEEDDEGGSSTMDISAPFHSTFQRSQVRVDHRRRIMKTESRQGNHDLFIYLIMLLIVTELLFAFSIILEIKKTKNMYQTKRLKAMVMDYTKDVFSAVNRLKKHSTCYGDEAYSILLENRDWRRIPRFVKHYRNFQQTTLFALPAHLDMYFEAVNSDGSENLMRYEWARYTSFKNFPEESPAMPSRLAGAGFYYTGPADKVQCFSCGLVYSNWNIGDRPLHIHKLLAPRCEFLKDTGDGNLSIQEEHTDIPDYCYRLQSNVDTRISLQHQCADINPIETKDRIVEDRQLSNLHASKVDEITDCKHPQYQEFSVRLSSFSKWPRGDIQDPSSLAEAGFFYAGNFVFS